MDKDEPCRTFSAVETRPLEIDEPLERVDDAVELAREPSRLVLTGWG